MIIIITINIITVIIITNTMITACNFFSFFSLWSPLTLLFFLNIEEVVSVSFDV